MYILSAAIVISIFMTCLGTVKYVQTNHTMLVVLGIFNVIFGIIFLAELVLRFVAALSDETATFAAAVCTLARSPMTWVDVLAIVPLIIDVCDGDIASPAPHAVQAMRLLRLLRLFTLARHFEGAIVLWAALARARPVLAVPLYFLVTAVLSFAGLMYVIEYIIYDNEDFDNVFICCWCMLVTMTTVGCKFALAPALALAT